MPAHDEGFFSAKDNLRIFWETDVPDNPKAHVAIIHGYMDHAGRFRRVAEALTQEGFAVHRLDLRGHGQSDGRRSHVDHFTDYLDDLSLFLNRVKQAAKGKKVFILAHSFGALLSLTRLGQGFEGISGLVVTSPFLGFAFKPPVVKVQVSKMVGKFIPWLPVKHTLAPSDLTRDVELQREVEKDPLYNRVTTPRWFTECVAAHKAALPLAPKLTVPLFVLVAPSDAIASAPVTRKFFEAAGSTDKKLKEYPGMTHEVMNDLGKEEVWRDISNWISAHL
jgi:lysophospholipase